MVMLNGFATSRREARYRSLWDGLRLAACPSVTSPTGLGLYDLAYGKRAAFSGAYTEANWIVDGGLWCINRSGATLSGINFHAASTLGIDLRTATTPTWSMFAFVKPTSSSSYPVFLCYGNWGASLGKDHASMKISHWRNNSTTHNSTGVMSTTAWNAVGIENRNLAGTFWLNGVDSGAYSGAAAITAAGGFGYASILPNFSINGMLQGSMDDGYLWDRGLSPAEWRLLSSGRGTLFQRRRIVRVGALLSGFKPYFAARRSAMIGGGA